MKKKIAILGSTGSIGKNTINIIKKNPKHFKVLLLSTNKNISEIYKQAKLLKVKNIIVSDKSCYIKLKLKLKNKNIKIYNNLEVINKLFKTKIDYTMSAISGLAGLKPTLNIIKFSKVIAIANKESIICAWNLIQRELNKNKTKFIPVDSEHFSIWKILNDNDLSMVKRVTITASGGPFLLKSNKKINNVNPKDALKHPTWVMGKKITIDSAALINKGLELIEATYLFNMCHKNIKILVHPQSLIHAMVSMHDGTTVSLMSKADMRIPISDAIFDSDDAPIFSNLETSDIKNLTFDDLSYDYFALIEII